MIIVFDYYYRYRRVVTSRGELEYNIKTFFIQGEYN